MIRFLLSLLPKYSELFWTWIPLFPCLMKSPDKVSSIMFTISWNQNSFIMGIQKQKEAKIEIDLKLWRWRPVCIYWQLHSYKIQYQTVYRNTRSYTRICKFGCFKYFFLDNIIQDFLKTYSMFPPRPQCASNIKNPMKKKPWNKN